MRTASGLRPAIAPPELEGVVEWARREVVPEMPDTAPDLARLSRGILAILKENRHFNPFGLVFWRFFLVEGGVETPQAKVVELADIRSR